ncbi:class I SAM-dependent methyltransferase [Actinopolymorpha sp. B17G11]|uniref:class I SAM-dependent methyltransferase n=1 Tax=unclassified Actinopolymorpha TaxID=2627063 RepID=UPI0032D99C80
MSEPAEHTRPELGEVFSNPGVAAAYVHRPPYPPEVFDILEKLVTEEPRAVLDIGAGDGAIARPLASRVGRVDALDVSAAMIEAGRRRPGGERPNLRWILGAVETAELGGPYALVTAGASLHWMRWGPTLNRLARVMTPHAYLAIVEHGPRDVPWQDDLVTVIKRHSRYPDYDPRFSVVGALQQRGLLELSGSAESSPTPFRQSVSDYVEQFHSTSSLAREHMSEQEARDFDLAVEQVVRPWAHDDMLELAIVATLAWGRPQPAGMRGVASEA